MSLSRITSPSNASLKRARAASTPSGLRREGAYLVEGLRAVTGVLENSPASIIEIIASETFASGHPGFTGDPVQRLLVVPDGIFEGVSATVHSQGVAAVCIRPSCSLAEVHPGAGICLVLDRISDPGNVGTMIRTAAAFDCPAVILTKGSCEAFSTKAVRASAGAVSTMVVVQGVTAAMLSDWARGTGVVLVAAVLDGTLCHELTLPQRSAIVIGSEAEGLSGEVLSLCPLRVTIPISSRVESLNAAVAAGILLSRLSAPLLR